VHAARHALLGNRVCQPVRDYLDLGLDPFVWTARAGTLNRRVPARDVSAGITPAVRRHDLAMLPRLLPATERHYCKLGERTMQGPDAARQ